MRTRHSIHDTPSKHVMIASFLVDGVQQNVDVEDEALNQELVLTPVTLPNTAHAKAVAKLNLLRGEMDAAGQAYEARVAELRAEATAAANGYQERLEKLAAELDTTPSTLPNPARATLEAKIFAKAEAEIAEKEKKAIESAEAEEEAHVELKAAQSKKKKPAKKK